MIGQKLQIQIVILQLSSFRNIIESYIWVKSSLPHTPSFVINAFDIE